MRWRGKPNWDTDISRWQERIKKDIRTFRMMSVKRQHVDKCNFVLTGRQSLEYSHLSWLYKGKMQQSYCSITTSGLCSSPLLFLPSFLQKLLPELIAGNIGPFSTEAQAEKLLGRKAPLCFLQGMMWYFYRCTPAYSSVNYCRKRSWLPVGSEDNTATFCARCEAIGRAPCVGSRQMVPERYSCPEMQPHLAIPSPKVLHNGRAQNSQRSK